MMPHMT